MASPDLNVIVCVDPRQCLHATAGGMNGPALLEALRDAARDSGLDEQVQITPCRCILGCTYGPRIDVARRWSGEKRLYGTIEGEVVISIRGKVRMSRLPTDLAALLEDNLPDK